MQRDEAAEPHRCRRELLLVLAHRLQRLLVPRRLLPPALAFPPAPPTRTANRGEKVRVLGLATCSGAAGFLAPAIADSMILGAAGVVTGGAPALPLPCAQGFGRSVASFGERA